MDAAEFLSFGDVVNVVVIEEAFPFQRDPSDRINGSSRNLLQGRVLFADGAGLHLNSHGGRCMPLFADDSSQIATSALGPSDGTFFPWGSVISVVKVADSAKYEAAWKEHERDEEEYYNAKGSYPESSSEFYAWRNSLSQAEFTAAYNSPQPN